MLHGETRPTILLVDDNPQVRSFIRPALRDSGFNCIEAVDGEEAVYKAETSNPDLIMLDIELGDPDMDGLDVCKRIRGLGLNMPVIFLTVRANVEDLERGLGVAGPGSDYVRKLEELRRMQVGGEDVGNLQVALKAPDTHELIARIRARLPRDVQELGPSLRIDRKGRSVEHRVGDRWEEAPLQPLEYEVLKTLADADGAVVGTWELFDRVFQGGVYKTRMNWMNPPLTTIRTESGCASPTSGSGLASIESTTTSRPPMALAIDFVQRSGVSPGAVRCLCQ